MNKLNKQRGKGSTNGRHTDPTRGPNEQSTEEHACTTVEGEDGKVQLAEVGTAVERRGKTALVDKGETAGREQQQAEVRAAVGEAARER